MAAQPAPDLSAEVQGFLDHWLALRTPGALMPTFERFLDAAPAGYMPHCYIVEVTDDRAVVRFQGTFLAMYWQKDYTGLDVHDGNREKFKAKSLANIQAMVRHPCGQHVHLHFSTSLGKEAHAEHIHLPLAVQPGRAPRIISLIWATEPPDGLDLVPRGERIVRSITLNNVAWLDIGAGTPAAPPQPYA